MKSVDPNTDRLDLLSDTVYREQACGQLDRFLRKWGELPVQKTQIYGLRQIARQQPRQTGKFAGHQRERAERKLEMKNDDHRLEAEIEFWKLVAALCGDSTTGWSVTAEGMSCLPDELREEAVPSRRPGMSPQERRRRKELKQGRSNWLGLWTDAHVPAFFERFCTHALYRSEHPETPGERRGRS